MKFKYYLNKGWVFIKDYNFLLIIFLIVIINDVYGWRAAKWIAIIWGIYCLILVWRGRSVVMWAIRDVETKIWGKSLDKENWNQGEFKKVKMRWRFKK